MSHKRRLDLLETVLIQRSSGRSTLVRGAYLLAPAVQIPLLISTSLAITGLKDPSLATGGCLWFQDLTASPFSWSETWSYLDHASQDDAGALTSAELTALQKNIAPMGLLGLVWPVTFFLLWQHNVKKSLEVFSGYLGTLFGLNERHRFQATARIVLLWNLLCPLTFPAMITIPNATLIYLTASTGTFTASDALVRTVLPLLGSPGDVRGTDAARSSRSTAAGTATQSATAPPPPPPPPPQWNPQGTTEPPSASSTSMDAEMDAQSSTSSQPAAGRPAQAGATHLNTPPPPHTGAEAPRPSATSGTQQQTAQVSGTSADVVLRVADSVIAEDRACANVDELLNRAVLRCCDSDYVGALHALVRAGEDEVMGEHPRLMYARGQVMMRLDQARAAVPLLRRAALLEPKQHRSQHARIAVALSQCYIKLKQSGPAREHAHVAVSADPDSFLAWAQKMYAESAYGDHEAAEAAAKRAASLSEAAADQLPEILARLQRRRRAAD